jgi:DNA invertase Pin-like site-specific DNA recombinase
VATDLPFPAYFEREYALSGLRHLCHSIIRISPKSYDLSLQYIRAPIVCDYRSSSLLEVLTMPSTYAYLRCSTDEQAQSGLGLAAQAQACQEFAETQGRSIDHAFTDEGVSRSTFITDRPGMASLLSSLRRGDVVIVAKLDRVGDSAAIVLLRRELDRKRCRLLIAGGDNSDTDESRLLEGLLSLMSDHELRMIRSRTRRAMGQKRQRGERFCRRLYGHDVVDGQLIENPAEQAIIARIVEERDYSSLREIAGRLNEDGIPAPEGREWYPATVSGILNRVTSTQVA